MTGVEFLPEEHGDDRAAHLDSTPGRTPQGRRPWWILGAAALAAGAVLWVATRPSDPQLSKHATQQAGLPSGTAASSSAAAAVACHGAPFCASTVDIPPAVRSALRQYLPPPISSLQVRTYVAESLSTGGTYLAERDINVVAGSVNVLVKLHRVFGPAPAPSEIVVAPPGVGSALVHRRTDAFVIDLQYLAPETVPPSIATLRVLAIDPRLEAL